jgi:hypothetical protein
MTARKTPKDTQAAQVKPEGMTEAQWAEAITAADADDRLAAQVAAQEALAAAQDEVLATVHPINGPQAQEELEAGGEAPSPQQVTDFAAEAGSEAKAAEVRQAAAEVGIPTRATWKQHGNPLSGWEFFGTSVKTPLAKGIKVAKVEVNPQGVTLLTRGSRAIDGGAFGSATKFWAVVPAEAPRKVEEPKAPKQERTVAEGRTSAADQLAAALAGDSAHAPAPEGYEIRWPKGGYDLLKRTPQAPADSPPWLVRCNTHNLTTPSVGGKAGDALGTKAGRLEWCSGCQADAKAEAQAAAKAAKAKATQEAKAEAAQAAEAAKAEAAQDATAEHDSAAKSEG